MRHPGVGSEGREITTIEELADDGQRHPVQEAWLEREIMAAVALLIGTSDPTDEEIDEIENVCRCGTYFRIREAIKSAAAKM